MSGTRRQFTTTCLAGAMVRVCRAQTEKPELPRAAIRVEHYPALKDLILDGDILYAFCVRDPDPAAVAARKAGEARREFPKAIWNDQKLETALKALNAIQDRRVRKSLILSSIQDLKGNLKRFPKDLVWVSYNTEPGMTPPEELENIDKSVQEFGKVAHAAGLKVGWGPTNAMLSVDEPRFLGLVKYIDSMGLQHQRVLENAGVEAFIEQTRRRSELVKKINPAAGTTVQVVVGRGTNEQCIQALRGVLSYVAGISVWTVRDTESEAQILAAVRGH